MLVEVVEEMEDEDDSFRSPGGGDVVSGSGRGRGGKGREEEWIGGSAVSVGIVAGGGGALPPGTRTL